MKTIINKLFLLISAASLLTSCVKDAPERQEFSSAVFINASPGTAPLSITVDTANLLSAGNLSAGLVHFGNTAYQGIQPGNRRIMFLNEAAAGRTVFADLPSENFAPGKAYTYFMYDTLINGRAKILRLNDEIAAPPAGNINVRFVHLAKAVGAVDVTLIRGTLYGDQTLNANRFEATDSVTIPNVSYVGDNPDINALSAFRSIRGSSSINAVSATNFAAVPEANRNNRYIIRIKRAGTQTVIAQNVTGSLPNSNTLITGRTYTIYLSGSVKGVATDFRVFQHFQY